jgi:hypothetical protein
VIRVFLNYAGRDYTVAGRTADDVCAEIEQKLAAGGTGWLTVNTGEGRFQEARLLLQPGVGIAVTGIDEEGREQVRQLTHELHAGAVPDH